MIKKKINHKLHNDLKAVIQEYMNLNDWTNQKDHTVQDLWNWIVYTKEWYENLNQQRVRILHEEKKEYYRVACERVRSLAKEFRENAKVIDRKIESKISLYDNTKNFRKETNLLNKQSPWQQ